MTQLTTATHRFFHATTLHELADTLNTNIITLVGAHPINIFAQVATGQFVETTDLAIQTNAARVEDEFLQTAITHTKHPALLSIDHLRAGLPIVSISESPALIVDIQANKRPFTSADISVFDILGLYFAAAIRNIEVYAELEARRAAVMDLNQVKNDLIAMLAHDFKAPLTTIAGLSEIIGLDHTLSDENRKFLGMINSSAMRLARLATETLTLSEQEQSALYLQLQQIDIVAIIQDIVRTLNATRDIHLRCSLSSFYIDGDAQRIRQVFENIIGNALKYSAHDAIVDVQLLERPGGIQISITDQGIGIPVKDLPNLFGRFARGSNARALGITGTGFGLYLSRAIIERHGGTITVQTKENAGSTFRIFFPALPTKQPAQSLKILLLDQLESSQSFIGHTLRKEGFHVNSLSNEKELFDKLDHGEYDAAIIDPDGLPDTPKQLLHRIGKRTPLVRLVATPEPNHSPWDVVLCKPFLIKDLLNIVQRTIADRRASNTPKS